MSASFTSRLSVSHPNAHWFCVSAVSIEPSSRCANLSAEVPTVLHEQPNLSAVPFVILAAALVLTTTAALPLFGLVMCDCSSERKTKAFGHELGLETDWNCCISLRDAEEGRRKSMGFGHSPSPAHFLNCPTPGGSRPHDELIMPRLPQGIGDVRRHLRE